MDFIPGLELNEGFYQDIIQPLMSKNFPDLPYSAALIGYGSDVMGYDTPISMDHMWGPRMYIFLEEEDKPVYEQELMTMFSMELPYLYKGYSTNYSNPDSEGVASMQQISQGTIRPLIWVVTVNGFVKGATGIDLTKPIKPVDWLLAGDQKLIEMVKGQVYYDGLGTLESMRERLSYFPDDVVRLKLLSMWHYIANEVAFIGRNRDLGSILGVKTIASRLVTCMMKMCFYMEGQFVPYSKWMTRSFEELECADKMSGIFEKILTSNDLLIIEDSLCEAYLKLIDLQNDLAITERVEAKMSDYYGRPYQVVFTEACQKALKEAVVNKKLLVYEINLISILQTSNGISVSNLRDHICLNEE